MGDFSQLLPQGTPIEAVVTEVSTHNQPPCFLFFCLFFLVYKRVHRCSFVCV